MIFDPLFRFVFIIAPVVLARGRSHYTSLGTTRARCPAQTGQEVLKHLVKHIHPVWARN
jgi:hypothetical protein